MPESGRFLVVLWDGGGNVPPALALVRRLLARGHDVRVLGPQSLARRITATGAQFEPYESVPEWDPTRGRALEDQDDAFLNQLCGECVADDVLTALERNPVDAALVDCMLGAALCATECMRVTTAAYVHCLYQPWHETWGTFVLDVQDVRAQLGLAALDPESPKQLLRPVALVPVFAPEGFDFPLGEPDERVRYVGPVFDPAAPPSWEPPWPPHNDDPLVVISFSTTYQHQEKALQTVLDAVADLPVRALMTLGPEVETGEFNAPPNVVAEAWVDHASVLPYASLVITHAGLGTVLASLAHGIPLVCLPGGREQPFNAERVEAVGAGRTVSADAGTTAVRCAIAETLSDAGSRNAATRIAATIAAQAARDQAVVEVERLLQ